MTITSYINDLSGFLHALAVLLFQTAMALTGLVLMGVMLMGAGVWFKKWRLYSRHPLAKRIRTFLRTRRQAREVRA